jgi:photosystem II stability/assembly factor-like uncharacterized protein
VRLSKVAIAASLLFALLIPIQAFPQAKLFPNWSVFENQPNLEQGGRTNSVAVNPMEPNQMFAASDSGGLFRSMDGGLTWRHVPELRAMFTQSVIYVPARPNVLLVTTKEDWKTANGGGVWRSDDGGMSWAPVTLHAEPQFPDRISAFGLSALGDSVVMGTSEGLFVSTNGGLDWTPSSPFPAGNRRVVSVLLTPGTSGGPARIYAGGPAGVRLNTLPLGEWTSPRGFAPAVRSIHAFGASARSNDHAYVAIEQRLFGTEDRGSTWIEIATVPDPTCAGTPFIKTALRTRGASQFFDLYHGNSCRAHRLTVDTFGLPSTWQPMAAEHFPRDLALFQNRPVLLASNGGLHNTADGGDHWAYVGGGTGGYNALQVTDIKGQLVGGVLPRLTLYFGTQDNNVWAVDRLGNAQGHDVTEGYFIDAQRRFDKSTGGDPSITYVACGPCRPRVAKQQLAEARDVGHSPRETAAPVFVRPGQRIQNVPDGLDVTDDPALMTWRPFASFVQPPVGLPKVGFAGAGDHTIVYQAYGTSIPESTSGKLMRIELSGGNSTVGYPVMGGFGAVAFNRLMVKASYPVFAVDHTMPDHLIAADIGFERMAKSTNGAVTWEAMTTLTDDLKDNNRLLFRTNVPDFANALPLVTAISYHPVDPSHVLLGTTEGGIYYSVDRGATWGKIGGSDPATYVTSFFWASLNSVYVSTFGRGIWRLENHPIALPEAFDELCTTCDVVSNDGPGRPPFDNSALVFEGRILGVRTDNRKLREVFVTAGSSVIFTGDPKDSQDDITITESDGKDTSQYEPLPKHADGWMVTGVVFTSDDALTGTVFSESELTLAVPEKK